MGQAQRTIAVDAPRSGGTMRYWVVGGVYTDTGFERIDAAGPDEEQFGPFESYKDAYAEWSRLAWRSVDDCHARYRIVARPDEAR